MEAGESTGSVVADATDRAREAAQEATSSVRDRSREELDKRTGQAAEQIKSAASDLRTVSEQLREQGSDTPARMADQASQRVERFGSYLSESDPDKLLSDLEDFGRSRPWLVLGAGVALGVAGARFLKASSRERYTSSSMQSGSSSVGDRSLAATTRPPASPVTGTERAASPHVPATSNPQGAPATGVSDEVAVAGGRTPTV